MPERQSGGGERQFVRRVLIVLALASVFALAWQLRSLILMLFGAVVVATLFRSLSERIRKWTGLPDSVSVGLSVAVILGGLAAIIAMFGAQIGDQVRTLGDTLPVAWASFQERLAALGLGDPVRHLSSSLQGGGGAFPGIGQMVLSVGGGIADVLVVVFGGIFLAAQPRFYQSGALKLVPRGRRPLAQEAMQECDGALRLWLKGQFIAMAIVGLLVGVGLWLLGMPSAIALGLLAALLEFIPFAGPIIAAIPAILIALAVSPDMALWVLLLYVAVQQFEGYLVQPLVQQYAVDLPGVVLLFALLGFGMLFGALGIILAAPLTVVTYVLVKRLYVIETLDTPTPIPGEDQVKSKR